MIRRPPRATLVPDTTLFRSTPVTNPRATNAPTNHQPCNPATHRLRTGKRPTPPATSPYRQRADGPLARPPPPSPDRKSTRLNSSHANISYAVFCLKHKKQLH